WPTAYALQHPYRSTLTGLLKLIKKMPTSSGGGGHKITVTPFRDRFLASLSPKERVLKAKLRPIATELDQTSCSPFLSSSSPSPLLIKKCVPPSSCSLEKGEGGKNAIKKAGVAFLKLPLFPKGARGGRIPK